MHKMIHSVDRVRREKKKKTKHLYKYKHIANEFTPEVHCRLQRIDFLMTSKSRECLLTMHPCMHAYTHTHTQRGWGITCDWKKKKKKLFTPLPPEIKVSSQDF